MADEMTLEEFARKTSRVMGIWLYVYGPLAYIVLCLAGAIGAVQALVTSTVLKLLLFVVSLALAPVTLLAMPLYALTQGQWTLFIMTFIGIPAVVALVRMVQGHPLVREQEPFPMAWVRTLRSGDEY